jgi:hypothetical protein
MEEVVKLFPDQETPFGHEVAHLKVEAAVTYASIKAVVAAH